MLIKNSIIKFFKQKMDIDVSKATITEMHLPGSEVGTYSHVDSTIGIDVDKIHQLYGGVSDIIVDTTVVHELMHLCQFKYNKSLILPLNSLFSGSLVNNRYVHLPAYQQPIEIDALVMECYYLYCSSEYNNEGIGFYAEHVLTNVKDVKEYTQRLKDDGFNSVMYQSQITKINSNKKEC